MSCGGPKKSPRTSSIVQIIFFFWVTDEGSLPEIVQYGPSSRFQCFTASKGSNTYFYFLILKHTDKFSENANFQNFVKTTTNSLKDNLFF